MTIKRLMSYWKSKFPNDIHQLVYEDFIENPEKKQKNYIIFVI